MVKENLRDSIIREHSKFIDIVELSKAFTLKSSINISNQNLRPFIEEHLSTTINCMILKSSDSKTLDEKK